jgi:hypothetical protein
MMDEPQSCEAKAEREFANVENIEITSLICPTSKSRKH